MKNRKSSISYVVNELSTDEIPDFTCESLELAVRVSTSVLSTQDQLRARKGSGKGHCRKIRFRDLEEAVEVLHRIQRYRVYAEEAGRSLTHRNERRAYKCPVCRGAHLTSKSTFGEVIGNAAA